MGLFSKEACTFCGKEVGMMHRSKLQTKEYICSECRKKTNPLARMDYTSRDAAAQMMETLPGDEAWLQKELERLKAEGKSSAVVRNSYKLGNKRIFYSCVPEIGVFQIRDEDRKGYQYNPVLYFDRIMPYQYGRENANMPGFPGLGADPNADYATVSESRDPDGKLKSCELSIPYQDDCIREIKFSISMSLEEGCKECHALADRINRDRRIYFERGRKEAQRQQQMQMRNLGDTATAALKAMVTGNSVEEALKQGIETSKAIEEGKVKMGFFGKLFKK